MQNDIKSNLNHSNPSDYQIGTQLIHTASSPDPSTGAVIPSISLSTTYQQDSIGVHKGFEYTRSLNPNRLALETLVASLEGCPDLLPFEPNGLPLPLALATASGSAATATVIQALVPSGGHVIAMSDVYGGTHRYLTKVATQFNVQTTFLDLSSTHEPDSIQTVLNLIQENIRKDGSTKLIWIESPSNPTLRISPLQSIAKLSKSNKLTLVVDNTFLSPIYQQPISLGADLVIHSATKYLNGHSDVLLGMIIGSDRDQINQLRFLQNAHGAVPSPFDCWLTQRGLKTLEIRMLRHGENALRLSKWLKSIALEERQWISKLTYPGLGSVLAWNQLPPPIQTRFVQKGYSVQDGFPYGGMISFSIDPIYSDEFLNQLSLFTLAESLGGVESLVEVPARMTHAGIPIEDRQSLGIDDGLIRMSVGIEEIEDLIKDVESSLGKSILGIDGYNQWKSNHST
ncbi:Cys/Met metabolism PLP-dependent enzyme-domain-containing protein [Melampsora americana]|nr:Cys/Met metabolism PLP-dependent enzyme-domain-containing protein [Melampsora americana]